jgi:hypothetical protein
MTAQLSKEIRFRATLEGSAKGRVFIVLPFDAAAEWGARSRHHVGGTINGRPFRGVVEQSGVGFFLPLGPAWRRANHLGPGDEVELVLGMEGPQRQDLAPDIAAALEAEPAAAAFFDGMAQFHVNNYLRWIDATRRSPGVRAERIAEMIRLLKAGYKQRPD